MKPAAHPWAWCLAWVAFVVYGSLVPWDFQPIPLALAWQRFAQIPILEIGAVHRADWISNIVLYVPVGLLAMQALRRTWPGAPLALRAALVMALGCALATAVEFTQLFFPPRTVALNDLFAEALGTTIGIAASLRLAGWLDGLRRAAEAHSTALATYALEAYALGYVAYSLFPYDLVLSAQEWQHKLASRQWGWLLAGSQAGLALRLLHASAECLLALPVGVLAARWLGRDRPRWRTAALIGLALGLGEELAQLLLVSGVSQGLSVATRALGVLLGAAAWWRLPRLDAGTWAQGLRRHTGPLLPAWAIVAATANRWVSGGWMGWDHAAQRWRQLEWLPFYYHYFTTEMAALTSLASCVLLYAPIGLLGWAHRWPPAWTATLAALAAAVFEVGKLFLARGHADPTNVLIAAAAAVVTLRAATHLTTLRHPSAPEVTARPADHPPAHAAGHTPPLDAARGRAPSRVLRGLALAGVLAAVLALAAGWPMQPALLMLALLGSAVLAWRYPGGGLTLLLAALPVADFAPWTGRHRLDEFDLLCAAVLAAAHGRLWSLAPRRAPADRRGRLVLAALLAGIALSAGIGLWAPPAVATAGDASPLAVANALTQAKGALWAALVIALVLRLRRRGLDAFAPLARGMVLGLAGTVAWIVWERAAFVGLLDFASDYRVSGPFSSMNVGGAYIECYLALAMPFLVWHIVQGRHRAARLLGLALLLGTVYALMVTFSRAGYLAFAAGLVSMLVGVALCRQPGARLPVLAAGGVALAVALPIALGPYGLGRLKAAEQDMGTRQQHWRDGIAMAAQHSPWWGSGLGRYPADHYAQHLLGRHGATFDRLVEGGVPMLRLAPGDTAYVEQLVDVQPRSPYVVVVEARSTLAPDAAVPVSVCEKWLLTSFTCLKRSFVLKAAPHTWQTLQWPFDSGAIAAPAGPLPRTVKLALHTPPGAYTVDVRRISLLDAQGRELLRNSRFEQGLDGWLFSAGNHLHWHLENLYLHLWYEQGWLGVLLWAGATVLAGWRALASMRRRQLQGWVAGSALLSWLVLGALNTCLDAPRLLLLALLTLALGLFPDTDTPEEVPRHG